MLPRCKPVFSRVPRGFLVDFCKKEKCAPLTKIYKNYKNINYKGIILPKTRASPSKKRLRNDSWSVEPTRLWSVTAF